MEKNILLVDDDEKLRELIGSYLEEKGFLVSTCADISQVKELINYLIFDLIILDRMLPGGDGIDLKSWIYCFGLLVGSYIYFVVVQAIGFLIASPLVLAGFTYLLGVRPWSFAFLTGVTMTAIVYGVFSIFGVPMPPGILPF